MITQSPQDVADAGPNVPPPYHPDLVIVRIEQDVVSQVPMFELQLAIAGDLHADAAAVGASPTLERIAAIPGIRGVTPLFTNETVAVGEVDLPFLATVMATSVRRAHSTELSGINLLQLSDRAEVKQVVRRLAAIPGVDYAEPVPMRVLQAMPAVDARLNRQWGLRAIRWFEADPLPDASDVSVAILDSGVDHPSNRWGKLVSYRFKPHEPDDIVGHGTHVTGIIAADSKKTDGLAGVCRAAVSAWKVVGDEPGAFGSFEVSPLSFQVALNEVLTSGARVVNLSLGGVARSRTEETLINRLTDAGIAVVAAAGNYFRRGNPTVYPGAYDGVIAVGASNELDGRHADSATGEHVLLSAPGANILSTYPLKPSKYRSDTAAAVQTGTSMAAPHVTGALALLLAREPGLAPSELRDRLAASARRVPAMGRAKRTREHGAGILDLTKLLS